MRTAEQTIADFYDASETRPKPGAGHSRWPWREESGSLYDREAHMEELRDEQESQELRVRVTRAHEAQEAAIASLIAERDAAEGVRRVTLSRTLRSAIRHHARIEEELWDAHWDSRLDR